MTTAEVVKNVNLGSQISTDHAPVSVEQVWISVNIRKKNWHLNHFLLGNKEEVRKVRAETDPFPPVNGDT